MPGLLDPNLSGRTGVISMLMSASCILQWQDSPAVGSCLLGASMITLALQELDYIYKTSSRNCRMHPFALIWVPISPRLHEFMIVQAQLAASYTLP